MHKFHFTFSLLGLKNEETKQAPSLLWLSAAITKRGARSGESRPKRIKIKTNELKLLKKFNLAISTKFKTNANYHHHHPYACH